MPTGRELLTGLMDVEVYRVHLISLPKPYCRYINIYMSFSQHFQASSQFGPEFSYLPDWQFFGEKFQVLLSSFGSEVKKSPSFLVLALSQEAVRKREWWRLRDAQGRPPGVLGMWPSRAVTFIDNHDTGSTQVYTTQHITLSQL